MMSEIKEVEMTIEEVRKEIEYEASMLGNTLLQNLMAHKDEKVKVFRTINSKGQATGYRIRNEHGIDVQL